MSDELASLLAQTVFFNRLQKASFLPAVLIAVFSLASYISSWTPPGTKTAFKFLIFPLVSWLVMAVVFHLPYTTPNTF